MSVSDNMKYLHTEYGVLAIVAQEGTSGAQYSFNHYIGDGGWALWQVEDVLHVAEVKVLGEPHKIASDKKLTGEQLAAIISVCESGD